jgi:hypothetical protein
MNIRKAAKQRVFLAGYAQSGIISAAAEAAGVSRQSHYRWIADPEYVAAFKDADEELIELLELEVRRRAMRSSDLLLIFALKAARPEKYR